MAMGHGQQRAIHPFFRRGDCSHLGAPTGSIAPSPLTEPNTSLDGPKKQSPASDGPILPPCPQPSAPDTPLTMLDHDPNASRRKRRKTDTPLDPATDTVIEAPSAEGLATAMDTAEPEQTPAGDGAEPNANKDQLPRKSSPRQKTISLNPNGKLLSSPVGNKFEDKSKKKRTAKRKVDAQKPTGGSKVVVIKYGTDKEARDRVGKLIDGILSGQKRHGPPTKPAAKPAPAALSATGSAQPKKPTHPFFMKKAANKSDVSAPQAHPQEPGPSQGVSEGTSESPASHGKGGLKQAFSTFRPRPKFVETINPIWPPRDFTHVRGVQDGLDRMCVSLELDRKKSKMAAVSISDQENVLLHLSRKYSGQPQHVLRIPSRHLASGKVLQTAVTRQLSNSATEDDKTLLDTSHPALRRLHASIPGSMTAFDLGHFDVHTWSQKYAPQSANQVLQATKEVYMLRDWLKYLTISAVDTGKSSKDDEKAKKKMEEKKRKRRKKEHLDGFIVSSEDEAYELDPVNDSDDELAGDVTTKRTMIRSGDLTLSGGEKSRTSNVILLSGPSGCGKTASIYAVAKELDFEVFEINPGNRRSARDIVERVGDMTRNHLVHPTGEESTRQASEPHTEAVDGRQNKLVGFFKSLPAKEQKKDAKAAATPTEADTKRTRNQKQSLILLEEADVLFEEDKQFWSGVLTLINQSKRPIIITCNDENLIPLQDINFHAILRYRAPPMDLAVDYLLLLTANEGHMLKRNAVEDLYMCTGKDVRRTIMELGFWCQMAVGSEKSGLDWMVDRWPQGSDLDRDGNRVRVLSLNTYEPYMGWFSRDMLMCDETGGAIESQHELLHWWQLGPQDSESLVRSPGSQAELSPSMSNLERLDKIREESELMDMRSTLDLLCSPCSVDPKLDIADISAPPMHEKQRASYTDGYTLLDTSLVPDYSSIPAAIACTFEVLLGKAFRSDDKQDKEASQAAHLLGSVSRPRAANPAGADLLKAFEPIKRAECVFPPPTGRLAPSFENGLGPIAEDLGPYIRGIMAYDLRLAQHRHQLSGLLSADATGTKRSRQTRASRAALEGGNKAYTRRERWFPTDANPGLILSTGKQEWQDLLVQAGHFTVPSVGEVLSRRAGPRPVSRVCPLLITSLPTELRFVIPPPVGPSPSCQLPPTPTLSSMSLFGTSPEDSPLANSTQRSKSSLFADEPSQGGNPGNAGSSLFADDDSSGSPWLTGTNKRTSKYEIVKTLLPDSDVPESYIDAYDLVLSAGDRVGSGVGLTSVREILSGSGLSATDQAKILNLVVSGDLDSANGLGRGEFSVLLALVGLAQEGEDLTFDAVDDRRKKLPVPQTSYFDALRAKQEPPAPVPSQDRPSTPPPPATPLQEPSSTQSRQSGQPSMGSLEADPWGSPQLHRGHAHTQAQTESEHPVLNGFGSVRSGTNAWSSRASEGNAPHEAPENTRSNGRADTAPASAGFGWGESLGNTSDGGGGIGGPVRAGLGGFGSTGSEQGEPHPRRRSLGIGRVASPHLEEVITVTLLPEKEGMFMFQHRNYEVKSARRGSTVVRRYSDFVWLLDCLHKRYPFRQLPLLPPKRISVNGTHLAADSTSFLEKRRRGLVRFTNALVRHPILSQEQLVIMFLTVPTELSVWRKQATISVQDEFAGRELPPDLEDSLPSDLPDMFDTVRSGVKRSAEVYINLCTLLERLAKRNEGLAADHLRFSLALQSLTEVTRDTYAFDTNDVPLLNEGIKATARHLSASQSLLEDEARAWEEGMLEDLKRQRDCLVGVREMFDRRDRYARNNIPQLERRIENNERKLQELRARPQGTVKPGEAEKVEEAIFKDKESIVHQHARGVFIKECIRDELVYFQQSQYHISRLHQDWSQERVKYSELQADNWRSLSDQVEGMPLGD
ncbi:hypothetical protein BO70DRAFT_390213 [Aspergillus heteromorphus CBS 117.55]|uniref:Sorting nexin MVP1 n=1 Tax=Aspergillus heteromorphus CBS 117.55 TaxID=1448321 RepID=A0A317V780_9EURO|nr:uncharacterized protein BO70DRAFT_390213 [Aspergillus heteromorphus CBS 117.55]PWY69121.1 hypothetical protein BO70DRAFT_390213 [Aspergillus heteromorphus CBS 117.55]